jgi:hypothetical protein
MKAFFSACKFHFFSLFEDSLPARCFLSEETSLLLGQPAFSGQSLFKGQSNSQAMFVVHKGFFRKQQSLFEQLWNPPVKLVRLGFAVEHR